MLLLRYRPRSIAEARCRMAEQGYGPDDIEETIASAIATDQLDDAAFTKLWIRDRMWHHPLSRAAIARELRAKGIASDLIALTLESEYPAVREIELARGLADARFVRLHSVEPQKRRQRTMAFLSRRGFSRSIVYQVLRDLEKELADD